MEAGSWFFASVAESLANFAVKAVDEGSTAMGAKDYAKDAKKTGLIY